MRNLSDLLVEKNLLVAELKNPLTVKEIENIINTTF